MVISRPEDRTRKHDMGYKELNLRVGGLVSGRKHNIRYSTQMQWLHSHVFSRVSLVSPLLHLCSKDVQAFLYFLSFIQLAVVLTRHFENTLLIRHINNKFGLIIVFGRFYSFVNERLECACTKKTTNPLYIYQRCSLKQGPHSFLKGTPDPLLLSGSG